MTATSNNNITKIFLEQTGKQQTNFKKNSNSMDTLSEKIRKLYMR